MFNVFGRNIIIENLLVLNFPYEVFESYLINLLGLISTYYSYVFSWASHALDRKHLPLYVHVTSVFDIMPRVTRIFHQLQKNIK
jgi:hypothetical protein